MRIKDILVKTFHVFLFGIFYYLLILAIGSMNLQSPLSSFVVVPLFLFLYHTVKIKEFPIISSKKTWYVLQSVSCIIMLIMVFGLEVDLTWDWGRLLITAYNYIMTGQIDYPEYFMRYPNNQFWLVCLIALFKVVAKCTASENIVVFKTVSMIVGVLIAQIGIYFIYCSAKLLWDTTKAVWIGIAALLYVPFYLYAGYLYNDIPGMCVAALLIYFAVRLEQEKIWTRKLFYAGIIGVLGACIMHIKIITFIVFIAVLISALLKNKIKLFVLLCGVMLLCFVGSYKLLEVSVNIVLDFDENETVKYEFPPTHWIMMMLNTSGGFKQEDVEYTWSFDSYEEKKEANIQKIKERLTDRGRLGTIKHILYTKQLRTWADSCIAGDNYVSRTPIRENSFSQRFFSINGEWHWICLLYTWIIHIVLLIGILLSTMFSFHKKIEEQKMLVGRIAVFGLFLFLSIWECNPRYLFTMMPVIILVASNGIFLLLDRVTENEKKLFICQPNTSGGGIGGGSMRTSIIKRNLKRSFGLDVSQAIKGIAIAIMLFHHLFRNGLGAHERYDIVYFPFPETNMRNIATVFKICVALFTFISGYRLYFNYKKTDLSDSRWVLQRIVKLLSSYWFVVVLCWGILSILNGYPQKQYFEGGFYQGITNMVIEFLGCANLFQTPTINDVWWYMSAAVIYAVLLPLIIAQEDKLLLLLSMTAILPRILGFGYQGGTSAYSFLFIFLVGVLCAKYDLVNKWLEYKQEKSFLKFLVELVLVFIGYKFYRKIPIELFWEYHFGLYPLLVIFFAVEFICFLPIVGKLFSFFGKHSANIFYIHSFFMMFSGFIYELPHFLLSYFVLMGISLGGSILIEALKEVFGYNKKFFKGG